MRKRPILLALLLTGCCSTTKIPVTESMSFTSEGNDVIVEDDKVYCLRLNNGIFWLPEPGDTIIAKKESLFGICPTYTYQTTK